MSDTPRKIFPPRGLSATGRAPTQPEMQSLIPRAAPSIIIPETDLSAVEQRIIDQTKPALVLPESMRARFSRPKEQGYKASAEQAAYFDWIENGTGNLDIEAVAGSGKSTTLVQGFRYMKGLIFCGAYNRAAAADLKKKAVELGEIRKQLHISTLHGFGMNDWLRNHPQVQVDDTKTRKLIERFAEDFPAHRAAKDYYTFINKMVSFGKQFLIGCRDKPAIENMAIWLKIMDHFSVELDLPDDVEPQMVMEWVMEIFRRSMAQCPKIIDFDDMIYAPLAYNVRLFPNDWVLIDERQDTNPARREMAKRILKRTGRAVFVGDTHQAIYGFTGAGGDSTQRIREEFKTQQLSLTWSFRCPKAVVRHAQQWVNHIEAHPDAPEGVVRPLAYVAERECTHCNAGGNREEADGRMTTCDTCAGRKRIPAAPWFVQDAPTLNDVILCRFTRPLIQTAYAMIKEGIACKVEGRDIGRGLITLARMWKITTIARLEERLASWSAREIAKAIAAHSEKKQQEIEDKVGTLGIFIARCRAQGKTLISDLVAEIEAMFADDVSGVVTLCSGHKSKGREWPRVYWIQTATSSRISKDWEMQEEINIKYVITTRAKSELILVPENFGKEGPRP